MDTIEAHNTKKMMTILGQYLFPQRPSTAKGQVVVITKGENAGEVYITHAQNTDGKMHWLSEVKHAGESNVMQSGADWRNVIQSRRKH